MLLAMPSTSDKAPVSTPGPPAESTESPLLSIDKTYELLKNRRRRDVLEYLRAHDGEVTLSDLAEHIAAWENSIEVSQLSSAQRKRVYIGLYQAHLPKMDSTGVIDFDKSRGTVVLREEAKQLFPYCDGEHTRPQPTQDAPSMTRTGRVLREAKSALIAALIGTLLIGTLALFALAPFVDNVLILIVGLISGVGLMVLVTAGRSAVSQL